MLDVVVPEDDERPLEAPELFAQQRFATRARDKVTRDRDDIGLTLLHPVDRPLDRDRPARGQSEVEVGEVCDPEPGQLRRQPGKRDVELGEPNPAGLEPGPPQPGRRDGSE